MPKEKGSIPGPFKPLLKALICPNCRQRFKQSVPNQIMCSTCRKKVGYYTKKFEHEVVCMNCAKAFDTTQPRALFCSVRCKNHYEYIRRKNVTLP